MKTKKTNNIAFFRRRRNLTIPRLSEITSIPISTLQRIESGGTLKIEKYRKILAKALNCKEDDLDSVDLDLPVVPLIGEVKHKSYVKLFPKDKWREIDFVEGLPPSAQAVRIAGTQLVPYHGRNDILYFDGKPEKKEKLFLDKKCLVQLAKGSWLICWIISKGTKEGLYTLSPYGSTQVMADQKITSAHPILHTKSG